MWDTIIILLIFWIIVGTISNIINRIKKDKKDDKFRDNHY